MAIITKNDTTTFYMSANYNVRINWTETLDTSTIGTAGAPYGKSSITFNVEMNPHQNGTTDNHTILPVFEIRLKDTQIFYNDADFINTTRVGITSANNPSYWYTLRWLNSKGQVSDSFFSKTISYIRTDIEESVEFKLLPAKSSYSQVNVYTTVTGGFLGLGNGSSVAAQLATLYTNVSAPTSVNFSTISGRSMKYGNNYYVKVNDGINISWSGAKAGTNNPIDHYEIWVSKNGGEYQWLGSPNTTYVDVNGGYNNESSPGDYSNYIIYAVGRYGEKSGSSPVSPRLYENRYPSAPIGRTVRYPSTTEKAPLSYSAGSDPDGHPITTYYSTSSSSHGLQYNNEELSVGTYYLWSYDGLNFSQNYSTATIQKDSKAPVTETIYYSTAQYTPYSRNSNYEYPNYIYINKLDYITGGSGVSSYNFYARGSSKPETIGSAGGRNIGSTSTPTFTIDVSREITSDYFQIGASITTTLGETSPIFWQDQIFCHGKAITESEFSVSISVQSNIDNNMDIINNLDTNLANYYSDYLKISWTNTNITAPRYTISKIEGGVVNESGAFTPTTMYSTNKIISSPNLAPSASNTAFLSVKDSIDYSKKATPAIRVTPTNGNAFIKKASATKTRINKLAFNGNYTISNKVGAWKFFEPGTDGKEYEIEFVGNKILGDTGFLIEAKEVIISADLLSGVNYSGLYTVDDSSTPGHISFSNFDSFKTALKELGIDSEVTITYTIQVKDKFLNITNPAIKITQTIDFRVAPKWSSSSPALTTEVHYLNQANNTYSSISGSTAIDLRVLNFNEKIRLTWPAATDPSGEDGNGDSSSIKYKITISTSDGASSVVTINSNSYTYNIPISNEPKGISFQVIAEDRSGLSTSVINSTVQLYIGRCTTPKYDLKDIKIENGVLSGKINITDYGDSRSTNANWKNYDRLGFILLESGESRNITLTLSPNNKNPTSFKSSSIYPTSGKVYLIFTLYPNYLRDYFSNITSYFFSFDGPTFSYRNHQIGINTAPEKYPNAALVVDSNTNITPEKKQIYFVVTNPSNPEQENIIFDLTSGNVDGLIINCGTW